MWIGSEHCVVNTDIEYNIASYDKIPMTGHIRVSDFLSIIPCFLQLLGAYGAKHSQILSQGNV